MKKSLKITLKILLALLVAGILFGIYFITRLSFIGPAISSGKYSHLGENLTSIILIAAYLCACITILKRKGLSAE